MKRLNDAMAFGGLLLLGAGLWFIYPPAAAVVVGAALFAIGVLGSRGEKSE